VDLLRGHSLVAPFVHPNHACCKKCSVFVSAEIKKRVAIGALRVWGKVERDDLPYLVLPLTVELSKPRLCFDA